jgi:hypothetical protein|tara:strand:- start:103 stop:1182 length:1080 start_codon:yes stop_codon:yes gene_type:complete
MATYVNNLRLKEIATGDESGTWGTSTNTNLELIGEALGFNTQASFSSDADATTTVADGATDPARALYFKVTSGATLTATRTLTIGPNTVSRVMYIENATTGSQSINISQGSGANVTIGSGVTKVVYLDGAGSGAAVVDANANVPVNTVNLTSDVTGTLPIANGGTGSTATTFVNLTSNVTGTLPVANGGTGITSLGSGVATFLGTPSSANLATAVTDETGSGALVFGTGPTLSAPVLGTPASGNLSNCTADGTNEVGTSNVSPVGTKTSAYTLATGDVGKYVRVESGGSIVIPDATFSEGDAISIFNNTTGNVTITCSITTAFIAGVDSNKSSMTLATRGVATILFMSGTVCVVSGSVS